MLCTDSKTNDEEMDENEFFYKFPPIFDVSEWLQSYHSSIHSFDGKNDQTKIISNSHFIKRIEINKINLNINPGFDKQGLLTKSSIIRILFWYQKLVEQMLILFKKRMNKFIQASNLNIVYVQGEIDSFILNLNELTSKCQKRIENCISSNQPDHIKQFQPLSKEQQLTLIDMLIESFKTSNNPILNYAEISKQLNIDLNRVENFLFFKKSKIKKYIYDGEPLPKWMTEKYSTQLNLIKQRIMENQH